MGASAFSRLTALLDGVTACEDKPVINLHLGQSNLSDHADTDICFESMRSWQPYPNLGGSVELRRAYINWMLNHNAIGVTPSELDLDKKIEPTPGSKQAIFSILFIAVNRLRNSQGVSKPIIMVPNPYYPTYLSSADFLGAQVLFYNSACDNMVEHIASSIGPHQQRIAAIIVCNPANPTGHIMDYAQLLKLNNLAKEISACLLLDECYIDFYHDKKIDSFTRLSLTEPPSMLCDHVVLHTLSKRSAAPGLRSGFAYGTESLIAKFANFNRTCGVSLSKPVCEISEKLWEDSAFITQQQRALAKNWQLADSILGIFDGYKRSPAGFFIWLNTGNGESFTRSLWRSEAVKVLPGAYLCDDSETFTVGHPYVRIALTEKSEVVEEALLRIKNHLQDTSGSVANLSTQER